jgi:hypothetical protein
MNYEVNETGHDLNVQHVTYQRHQPRIQSDKAHDGSEEAAGSAAAACDAMVELQTRGQV